MSTVLQPPTETAPEIATEIAIQTAPTLGALRSELDRIDDAIHDLIMARAATVERVRAHGNKGAAVLRPGREAAIARRLLQRHTGSYPRSSLVRVWRELICGNTALQRPIMIAVCEPDGNGSFAAAAREQFGALAPIRVFRTPAQAIGDVSAGIATAAVLPLPAEDERPATAWWIALLHHDEPRIHVTARLPFWSQRPEGAPDAEAMLVCAAPPDPSGEDRSLLGLEVSLEVSRARLGAALMAAGFAPGTTILRRDPGAAVAQVLVDVDGFVADDDPRLGQLTMVLRPPVVVGAYAVSVPQAMPR